MFRSGKRICVVDDEEAVRTALRRLFRSAGFEVETFASGREFLDSLKQHRPDCAILDLHLPELSGLEIQQRLGRENQDLPIIIITGRDEAGLSKHVLAAGSAAYLNKPVEERVLLEAVAAATRGRDASKRSKQAGADQPLTGGPK